MSISAPLSRRAARLALVLSALAGACSTGPSAAPGPSPSTGGARTTPAGPTPLVQGAWPVRTRQHIDLWLHSYALLTPDTTLVPYFRRGYRDRLLTLRRQRGTSTLLDANRSRLLERIAIEPSLGTNPQFLPLYFESWDQMRQAIDLFVRANGNPNATNDPTIRAYFGILGGYVSTVADREWLRQFTESVDDESRRFHHDYWTGEQRTRATVVSRADSLWQLQWRPALQRFLNNTLQQNGELFLSLPLGGEGRTIHYGKQQNAVAVTLPDSRDDVDQVLYVTAHETVGALANTAITDNLTPAERRSGVGARFEQAAAVRAGALLLERTIPSVVPGYMRYYLQQAGRPAPNDPRAAFASVFTVPDAVRDAIAKQLDVILGGI